MKKKTLPYNRQTDKHFIRRIQ